MEMIGQVKGAEGYNSVSTKMYGLELQIKLRSTIWVHLSYTQICTPAAII